MPDAAPEISVLTPSFGYGRYLTDCIESVRRQEGVSVQHVVQDGGSTDSTQEVLRSYPDVTWRSEPDEGQSDALNRALQLAEGRWIAWLNADEFYLPGALAALLQAAESSRADVVYGDAVFVDEHGALNRLAPQHRFDLRVLREFGCYISSCALLVRRDALDPAPWDVTVQRRMDWDLYMRLATTGRRFTHLPRPIAAFREHDERVTASPWHDWIEEDARLATRFGMAADPDERWRDSRGGRWKHAALKLRDGAYLRQWRSRALTGRDLRWFDGTAGADACHDLLDVAS